MHTQLHMVCSVGSLWCLELRILTLSLSSAMASHVNVQYLSVDIVHGMTHSGIGM